MRRIAVLVGLVSMIAVHGATATAAKAPKPLASCLAALDAVEQYGKTSPRYVVNASRCRSGMAKAANYVPTNATSPPTVPATTRATTPPTAPPTPAPTAAPAPVETAGQSNARRSAQQYLRLGNGFSRDGLIKQLSSSFGEGFSLDDATYGV